MKPTDPLPKYAVPLGPNFSNVSPNKVYRLREVQRRDNSYSHDWGAYITADNGHKAFILSCDCAWGGTWQPVSKLEARYYERFGHLPSESVRCVLGLSRHA